MRRLVRSGLLAMVVGLAGCGSDDSIIVDPSRLKPETEEEARQIKDHDAKINEEEGGQSFGARVPKKVATPKR
jgi:hypothetical protein